LTRLFTLVFASLLMTGCVSSQVPAIVSTRTLQANQATSATESILTSETGAPQTQMTSAVPENPSVSTTPDIPLQTQTVNVPFMIQSEGTLTVKIFSASNVEVTEPTYIISGTAPDGTVISANDQIALVDQTQTFSLKIKLDEGPNLIQIVASDLSGDEVSFMITVTYISQS
jgi:hypothetical protein